MSAGGDALGAFMPRYDMTDQELEILLDSAGHRTISIEKAEYGWETEFDDPPASMGAPYPWDWFAVSTPKRKK